MFLINNAGTGDENLFHNSEWEKAEKIIDLNVKSVISFTHLIVPRFLKQPQSKCIVFIGLRRRHSLDARQPPWVVRRKMLENDAKKFYSKNLLCIQTNDEAPSRLGGISLTTSFTLEGLLPELAEG